MGALGVFGHYQAVECLYCILLLVHGLIGIVEAGLLWL